MNETKYENFAAIQKMQELRQFAFITLETFLCDGACKILVCYIVLSYSYNNNYPFCAKIIFPSFIINYVKLSNFPYAVIHLIYIAIENDKPLFEVTREFEKSLLINLFNNSRRLHYHLIRLLQYFSRSVKNI